MPCCVRVSAFACCVCMYVCVYASFYTNLASCMSSTSAANRRGGPFCVKSNGSLMLEFSYSIDREDSHVVIAMFRSIRFKDNIYTLVLLNESCCVLTMLSHALISAVCCFHHPFVVAHTAMVVITTGMMQKVVQTTESHE